MNLSHLYYFRKLAEVKHYTRAARELYIAQPTLSGAIAQLEKELGAPLFTKTAHQVELTDCGRDFYEHVCLALINLENGVALVRERVELQYATLKLGTTFAMQGKHWSQAVQEFKRELDVDIPIDIEQGFTYNLVDELKTGKLDVVFGGKIRDDPDLHFLPCWSQQLVLGVHRDHPLAKRKSISLEELRPYHMAGYVAGTNPAGEEMRALVEQEGLSIEQNYNDEITLCSLVSSDPTRMALICYSFLVKSFDDVAVLTIDGLPKDFHKVYLIYRNDKNRLKIVDRFIEFISSYSFPEVSPDSD